MLTTTIILLQRMNGITDRPYDASIDGPLPIGSMASLRLEDAIRFALAPNSSNSAADSVVSFVWRPDSTLTVKRGEQTCGQTQSQLLCWAVFSFVLQQNSK